MFEDLFGDRGTIARYLAAPLLDERLSYLRHCAQTGAWPCTLQATASHQFQLVHILDLHEDDRVSLARIEAATRQWSVPGGRNSRQHASPKACRTFFGHAVRWLRFVDMLEEPDVTRHAHVGEVAIFEVQNPAALDRELRFVL
ncbi:MAG: hypothetical protein OXE86_17370 [Alphaproteobacteria bacterium]|nr:hypothetical protein [Alphaproteobacteria bacterium]